MLAHTNYSRRPDSWDVTAMSDSHRESEMVRTIKGCWRCEQTDYGRAGWTDDFHFSPFAAQRKDFGRVLIGFDGNPGIREWETLTDFYHVEESIPRPRTLLDTNDSLHTLWLQNWT